MPVFKDEKTNKWYAMVRFTDWQGQRKQKCKRGFATRRDALEWEKVFQMQTTSDLDMSFEAFVEMYKAERQPRLKQTTWMTKGTSSTRRSCHTSASGESARSRARMLLPGRTSCC